MLVATAPGHRPVRQVVRLPASAPVTIALEATVPVAEGIVLAVALERVGRQVRITVRRHGGGEASREVDPAAVAATTRELAETLAGVPRAVASAGTSGTQGTGDAAHGGAAGRVGSAGGRRGGSGRTGPPDEGGGSVFGKWWFWTIVGGVVVIGVLGLAAANRRDQGTDVHVGIAP